MGSVQSPDEKSAILKAIREFHITGAMSLRRSRTFERDQNAREGRGIAMNKARKTTRKLSKAERSEAIKKGIRRNRLVRKRRAEAEAKRT